MENNTNMVHTPVKVIETSEMVVTAYNLGLDDCTKIVYRRHGDEELRALDCGGETCTYYDVICCGQKNTVFALGPGPSVESWDFNEAIPTKTTLIQGRSCPRALALAHHRFPPDLYDSYAYLASTPLGQIFLIVMYVADESLGSTVDFLGFRLDLDRREWIFVESFNSAALFWGLNQTVLVPAFEDEVIFYSNDYWEGFDGVSCGVVDAPAPPEMMNIQEVKKEEEEACCS